MEHVDRLFVARSENAGVFGRVCHYGFLSVPGDFIYNWVRGKSLLGVGHNVKNTLVLTFAWPLGAVIIGWLGHIINILQPTIIAAAVVGIGWPAIFVQIVESATPREDIQQPTDEIL